MPRVSKHIRDGVTVKQRKLAKNLAKGLSKAESMRKAGYNSNHPTTDANKQLQNTKVVEVMKKEEARLEKIAESKLDNDTLIDKHVELLHAQDESGNNAYAIQQGALRDAYKLKKAPGFGTEVQQHTHLHADVTKKLFQDLDDGVIDSDSYSPGQEATVEGSDSES